MKKLIGIVCAALAVAVLGAALADGNVLIGGWWNGSLDELMETRILLSGMLNGEVAEFHESLSGILDRSFVDADSDALRNAISQLDAQIVSLGGTVPTPTPQKPAITPTPVPTRQPAAAAATQQPVQDLAQNIQTRLNPGAETLSRAEMEAVESQEGTGADEDAVEEVEDEVEDVTEAVLAAEENSEYPMKGHSLKGSVNVRTKPSKSAYRIGTLDHGQQVQIRSKQTDDAGTDWYFISFYGRTGYVMAKFIQPEPKVQPVATVVPTQANSAYNTANANTAYGQANTGLGLWNNAQTSGTGTGAISNAASAYSYGTSGLNTLTNPAATGISNAGSSMITNPAATGISNTGSSTLTNPAATGISNTGSSTLTNPAASGISNTGSSTLTNPAATGISNTGSSMITNPAATGISNAGSSTLTNPAATGISNTGSSMITNPAATGISNTGSSMITNPAATGISNAGSSMITNPAATGISNTGSSTLTNPAATGISNTGSSTLTNPAATGISNAGSSMITNPAASGISNAGSNMASSAAAGASTLMPNSLDYAEMIASTGMIPTGYQPTVFANGDVIIYMPAGMNEMGSTGTGDEMYVNDLNNPSFAVRVTVEDVPDWKGWQGITQSERQNLDEQIQLTMMQMEQEFYNGQGHMHLIPLTAQFGYYGYILPEEVGEVMQGDVGRYLNVIRYIDESGHLVRIMALEIATRTEALEHFNIIVAPVLQGVQSDG